MKSNTQLSIVVLIVMLLALVPNSTALCESGAYLDGQNWTCINNISDPSGNSYVKNTTLSDYVLTTLFGSNYPNGTVATQADTWNATSALVTAQADTWNASGMTNPATSNLDMNNYSFTNISTPICSGVSYCAYINGTTINVINSTTQNIEFTGVNTFVGTGKDAITNAMNQTESNGGGIVLLYPGTYIGNINISWIWSNVKLKGFGMNKTIIKTTGASNVFIVNTNNVKIDIEDIYIQATDNGDEVGMGIYSILDSGSSYGNRTFDLYLKNVKFITLLNAIFIRNDPNNTVYGLGNVSIKDSEFYQNSQNTDGTEYPAGQYHTVVIEGHKDKTNEFIIDNNRFIMDGIRRTDSASLSVTGDSSSGNGTTGTSIDTGTISNNYFDNSTRECFLISDIRNFKVQDNTCDYSDRIGIYVIRSYRSIVTNNIVNYSAMRGLRIDTSDENTWIGNKAFHSGSSDTFDTSVGGMTVYNSSKNIIIGNTILADKNSAILMAGTSSNNIITDNIILGSYRDITYDTGTNVYTGSNNTIRDNNGASPFDFGSSATAPTAFGEGDTYYNSSSNVGLLYDGTQFITGYGEGTILFTNGSNDIATGYVAQKKMLSSGIITALYLDSIETGTMNITASNGATTYGSVLISASNTGSSTGLSYSYASGDKLNFTVSSNSGIHQVSLGVKYTKTS